MLNYLKIEGFKSIKSVELDLGPINILIGGNGSGKSNFLSFFRLVNIIFRQRLQEYALQEGADRVLHYGRKTTPELYGKLIFVEYEHHNNAYFFRLKPTSEAGLFIEVEGSGYNVAPQEDTHNYFHNRNLQESKYAIQTEKRNVILQEFIKSLQTFHFHDTSSTSYLRRACEVNDNQFLKPDGRNLPAILYALKEKHPAEYNRILTTIQSIAPFIADFILEPKRLKTDEIELRWIDKGDPNSNFSAYDLSDGTIRFIALTTLLLQPEPPEIIIIDEPELGLHPFALDKLAGMFHSVSSTSQIIAATQSPGFINNFQPEDIIVIDRDANVHQSTFRRLDRASLEVWLQEFSLGYLWERNIIDGAQPFEK